MPMHSERAGAGASRPADPVQRWMDLGIITADQASAIRADQADQTAQTPSDVAAASPGPAQASLVAEALGYLGGAIILVALGLATGWFWPELSGVVRVNLAALVAAALLVAGLAVPVQAGHRAAVRLRSVLWLLSVVALAGCLALLADEAFGWTDERQALLTSAGTALLSAALWRRHHHLLQHLGLLASLTAVVGTATALVPGSGVSSSASVWALGLAWCLLGWGGVLHPRREAGLAGVVVTLLATASFAAEPWGSPLALTTLALFAVLAVRLHDLALLAVTALATLADLPPIVDRYFHGLLSAAAILLLIGGLLVAAAVVTVRRPGPDHAPAGPPWTGGTPAQGEDP